MKLNVSTRVRRVALFLPALGLLLAPLSAQSRERSNPSRENSETGGAQDLWPSGRGGVIEEFNFGPPGMDVILQREDRRDEGGNRLLSGRVIELKGRTLYVERDGVVVPLDVSALRFAKEPREGQEVIASYAVDETRNVALSLAGAVEPPAASGSAP